MGACALLCSLQTESPGFQLRKLTPRAQAAIAQDTPEFSLPSVFLYLSAKNAGKGKIIEDWGNVFHILYYPVLSQSSQSSHSRFRGRLA